MFTYSQTTGELCDCTGAPLGTGYAGNGAGLNNPAMQDVHGRGPLPRGIYTIGKPHDNPHTGVFTMNLDPDPANEMFGRSLFRMHGDTVAANETASDGCIVQPPTARHAVANQIAAGAENRLTVTM